MAVGMQSFTGIVRRGGDGNSFDGPFSIQNGSTSGSVKINYYSSLLKSENPNDKIAITGLDSDIEITGTGYIWLEIDFTDINNAVANINNGADGWPGFPVATVFNEDNTAQLYSYVLIGTIVEASITPPIAGLSVSSGSTSYIAYRHVYQDLMLLNICSKIIAIPSVGGTI